MLTSPSGKSYIGQTTRSIETRFRQHRRQKGECVAIYRAIQKHGWENMEKDWYECPDEDLNFDEELLVREMGTLAPNGYNLREGGGNHGKLSDETKRKMSEARQGEKHHMYGKTHTDDSKRKMSEIKLGKIPSEETKRKRSEALKGEKNPMYGKPKSVETRQKMSDAHRGEKSHMFGKPKSDETKRKLSEANRGEKHHMYGKTGEQHYNSKKVYQYGMDGNLLGSFGSCAEAGRYLNKKSGTKISTCACGNRKTAYGFKWSYTPQV